MAYIDVRGVYPSFISGQFSISLEEVIKTNKIPEKEWRGITVNDAAALLGLQTEPINADFTLSPDDTFENLAESFGFTPDEFRNIGK